MKINLFGLLFLIFITNSCTSDKTLDNVTINDDFFYFQTANGKEVKCILTYNNKFNYKDISNDHLKKIIIDSNFEIKSDLNVPSSFVPVEYIIDVDSDNSAKIKLSFKSLNSEGKEVYDLKQTLLAPVYEERPIN